MRACPVCGATVAGHGTKVYCSSTCRKKAEHARAKARGVDDRRPTATSVCRWCGETYMPKHHSRTTYCSRRCYFAAHATDRVLRLRRVRIAETQRGWVNKRKVYERDGWVCGICGLAVDPTLAHPHPMSASLDHIHPLAQGGTHTYDNVQCAHLICNLRKGERVA